MRRRVTAIAAAIGVAIGLAACGPSPEDANRQARAFCETHGGVAKVEYWPSEWPYSASFDTDCRDGSEYE